MTTPAGWYPDPENAGQQRYWDGTQWTEHRTPPPKGGLSTAAKVLIGGAIGLLMIGGRAALLGSSSDQPTVQPSEPAPAQSTQEGVDEEPATPTPTYKARITTFEPVNPATIRFEALVKRPAAQSEEEDTSVICTVKFSDPSGTYDGFDFFDVDILAYSSRRFFGGNITITNEGAVWVTQQSIKCEE
jgi:Protein of unknown function (DUF2510)